MYKLHYSKFVKLWFVMNTTNGQAQSSWKSLVAARNVARLLNRVIQ